MRNPLKAEIIKLNVISKENKSLKRISHFLTYKIFRKNKVKFKQ